MFFMLPGAKKTVKETKVYVFMGLLGNNSFTLTDINSFKFSCSKET